VAFGERSFAAVAAGVLGLLWARDSLAFCQATTCDEKTETCRTEGGCVVEGSPQHWESRCLSFGVQNAGSPLRHISYRVVDDIMRKAFSQWMNADCGGGAHPSFEMWDLGAPYGGIICDSPEFNALKPNANVVMFRDHDWPYEGVKWMLAQTSTIFDTRTGALLDADIEINSFKQNITTTDLVAPDSQDLQAILTHEAGHFLGLAHSNNEKATMFHNYEAGDLNYRSLHPDDMAGICAVYPPDRDAPMCVAPSPPHGFSLYCGGGDEDGTASATGCTCSMPATKHVSLLAIAGVAAVAAGAVGRRRRRNLA
jgi:MYXO-CTERM domain-containing protein